MMLCKHENTEVLGVIYKIQLAFKNESLTIRHCKDCDCVFKYRYQYDEGTGSDSLIIYPGQVERDVSFSLDEFFDILKKFPNLLSMDWERKLCYENMKPEEIKNAINKLNRLEDYYKNLLREIVKKI